MCIYKSNRYAYRENINFKKVKEYDEVNKMRKKGINLRIIEANYFSLQKND